MESGISELFDLRDRDIWVFGGAGHLGRVAVTSLRACGARVLCVDLDDRAEAWVAKEGFGSAVAAASLDLRDIDAMKTFVASHIASRGVPNGAVNLTFQSTGKSLEGLTENEFDDANQAALTATFSLAREVGAAMKAAGRGSIVLFSSMYGMVSPDPRVYELPMLPNPIEYGVTKAGILQMARYFAVHWGRAGVRVNCISPGPFPNAETQRREPGFVDRLSQRSPMGRIGQSPEIAGALLFLLSDASSYVTGHNLVVDGGWTAW